MTSSELLRKAVDLYRGEIAFPVTIAALPGRGGPDAAIVALYSGAVGATVAQDNSVAPTGVLGLGWTLQRSAIVTLPPGNESAYAVQGEQGLLPLAEIGTASDGSRLFATLDYRFWKIAYDPRRELWTIVFEDGSRAVYGDSASGRGTVDWSVAWGGWRGASNQISGQRPLAVGWSLSQRFDLWGNAVTYRYTQVSAPVGGPTGLSYTRATYLDRVTGAGGDEARFTYGAKAAFECPPRHADPGGLNAWQERYESLYLQAVAVFSPSGVLLGTTTFDFEGGTGHTQYVGQGTSAKRLLMGVETLLPGAVAPPAQTFSYVTQSSSPLLGTMASAQTPEGALITYGYAPTGLTAPLATRDLAVGPPVRAGVTFSQPQFRFADDYVVATWLGSDSSVQAVAYRWVGRWIAATLGSLPLGSAAYASVAVALAADSFCLAANGKLLVYRADPAAVGGWNGASAPIALTLQAGETVAVACGPRFAAALGQASGKLNLVHWDGAAWVADPTVQLPGPAGALCAALAGEGERLLAVSAGTASGGGDPAVRLMSLDPFGAWTSLTTAAPRPMPTIAALSAVIGDGLAAFSASGGPAGNVQLAGCGVTWPADLSRLDLERLATVTLGPSEMAPSLALRGAMLGLGGLLFRYDGAGWNPHDTGAAAYPGEQAVTGLTYGLDLAVRTMTGAGQTPLFDLAVYDPGTAAPASPWSVPAGFAGAAPTGGNFAARAAQGTRTPSRYIVFPVASGNVWSNGVWAQAADGSWTAALSVTDSLSAAETASLQVLGESCCLYQTGTTTIVYPLRDGAVSPAGRIPLTNQQVLIPSGTGAELVGPSSFVTYSGTWGQAGTTLTLHRVVRDAVAGAINVQALATTRLDDGYALHRLAVAGDPATATVSPDGWRAALNQATSAEGTDDVANAPNGTSISWFFNNLTAAETPAQPYPTGSDTNAATVSGLMAGQVYTRKDRAAGTGSPPTLTDAGSATFYWWGYRQALSSVAGDNRAGFYVRQRRLARLLDGVTTTVRTAYAPDDSSPPVTGLPIATATDRFNAAGVKETVSQAFTYFWEKYDPSRALNILSPVVQTVDATDGTTTGIAIETWRNDWTVRPGAWATSATWRALAAAPAAFDWTTGSGAASSWLFGMAVAARSPRGVTVETVDALGRYSGSVRSADDLVTTAAFVNARLDQAEAGYFGCEPYEANPYWGYAGGGAIADHITDAQAHTGTRSVQIDPTAAGVKSGPAATFLRTTGSDRYLFSCWLLTELGFGAAAGNAGWELQVYTATSAPVAVGSPIALAFPDTAATWAYLHQIVDLAAVRAANPSVPAGTPLCVGLLGCNQKAGKTCWVDELRFSPLDCAWQATVFDSGSLLPAATLGPNGQTMRMVRDSARTIVASVGPDENVAGIASFTYARSLSANGGFDPNLPNSLLQIGSIADGVYFDFDPSDKATWTLPDSSWDVTDRQLVYTGSTTPPAFSQAKLTGFSHGNYALKVDVRRQAASANVRAGTGNVYVTWDANTADWTLFAPSTPGGAAAAVAARSGRFAESWTLALVEELVLFYADGLQVFCYQLPGTVRGDGQLILGLSGPGSFSELVCAVEPQISVGFVDGAGKRMQTLSLVDGHTIVARGTLYDNLQRPQYEKDPITNPPMIGAPPPVQGDPPPAGAEQVRLIGDIDSYLPYVGGQPMTVAQYTAPANGYPFTQTSYETAPMSRMTEAGAPGPSYAVGSGHSYRFVYGSNTANDPLTPLLPVGSPGRTPGSYATVTTTDPNNVTDYQLINQSGQLLARRIRTGGTEAAPTYQTTMYVYDPAGRLTTVQLPNYFSPPAGSTAAPWVIQRGYDFLGRPISLTTPDSGQTQYAYDSAGRLRFVMDADGAAQSPQRFKYHCYDALDRTVQIGTLQQNGLNWAGLAAYVDQQAWPAVGASPSVYAQYVYDSDGAGTDNLEGRLWQETIDNAAAGLVTERYAYDRRGNVLDRTTSAAQYGPSAYLSASVYNNLDLPIMTTYPRLLVNGQPSGTPFQVTYFYDRLGQLAGVGQPPAGGEVLDPEHPRGGPEIYYASYYYNPMGEVITATLNDNAGGAPIQRTANYNSAGWPTAIGGDFYRATFTYDQGGFGGAAYYDGKIASISSTYAAETGTDPWVAPPTLQRQWAYQYDALGRVQVADPGAAADQASAALAIGSATAPVSYDSNGNLIGVPRGPTTEQYSYLTGTAPNQVWNTNRVQTVTAAAQANIQFATGQTYAGWTWGASNGGPSASATMTPTGGGETLPPGKALQLAGGSPGHAEYLQFAGFLAMGGTYQLSYWIKTPDPFAAQTGPAGWGLRLFTDTGAIVDAPIRDLGAGSTTWLEVDNVTIDTQSLVASMGLDSHIVSIALVLINGKVSGTSAPGASLQVADVTVSGSAPVGQYGYASPNGYITSASGRQLSTLSYHPFTGLVTGATVTGARATTVSYAYGPGTQRSGESWTDTAGSSVKLLDLFGPNGAPVARRINVAGTETVTYFLHGAEGLLASVPAAAPATTYYALNDQQGSPRAIVDQNAALLQTYDYGPFGEMLQGPAAPVQPFAYTGQPTDPAIGLSNYQARLYDPALRRFCAPDPGHEGASSYAYVGNDPVNLVDPTGMFGWQAVRNTLPIRAVAAVATGAVSVTVSVARHFWANLRIYLPAYLAFSTTLRQLIEFYVRPDDFYKTDYGMFWTNITDLNNFNKEGWQKYPRNILESFSRNELLVISEYFPVFAVEATVLAWGSIYYPVSAAVSAASAGGEQKMNAVRHVTWMCGAKRFLGRGDSFATDLGEAHEIGRPAGKGGPGDESILDEISDRINNAIALHLTGEAWPWPFSSCKDIALEAWDRGILARNQFAPSGQPESMKQGYITTSWKAGINFLKGTAYAAKFSESNKEELRRRGIDVD